MAIQLPNGRNYFEATGGGPGVGYRLYAFVPGTSTPKDTYTTSAGSTPNTHPVVMNARGEAAIYWSGSYDVVLRDAADALIWGPERLDDQGSADDLRADLADTSSASNGDALIGVKRVATGAVATTAHAEKEREGFTPEQLGAVGDGVADDGAKVVLALAACAAAGLPLLLPNIYAFGTTITLPNDVSIYGLGGSENCGFIYTGTGNAFEKINAVHTGSAQHMNVEYRDFMVRGPGTGASSAFYFEYADHWHIKNVRIENFTNTSNGSAVRLKECYWWQVEHCKIDDIGRAGIWMEGGASTGCNAGMVGPRNRINANNHTSCVGIECNGQQVSICDNDLEGGNNGLHGINLVQCEGTLIQGNYIELWTGMAIKGDAASTTPNSRVTVSDNAINSAGTVVCGFDNSTANRLVSFTKNRFLDIGGSQTCVEFGTTTEWNLSDNDYASGVPSDKVIAPVAWCPMMHFDEAWTPSSIAAGAVLSTEFSVGSGVTTNDRVIVTMNTLGAADVCITGYVRSTGVIRVLVQNREASSAFNPGASTVYITVLKANI